MIHNKADITSILPDRDIDPNVNQDDVQKKELVEAISKDVKSMNSREIAKIKLYEKRANELNQQRAEKKYQTAEILKSADLTKPIIALPVGSHSMAGTTKPEIAKLLHSLNINLNISLTKNDTYNLLATLLTCNETQLRALEKNNKVPLAVKIIIKRLLEDYKVASTATVEMVWNRIFGNSMASFAPQDTSSTFGGLLSGKPVSREAYMVIRETIIGKNIDEQ